MAYQFLLAGQDITPYVQWTPDQAGGMNIPNAQRVQIDSKLGQGPGLSAGNSGRAATATFLVALGPANTAAGAGTVPMSPMLVRQGEIIVTDTSLGTRVFGGFVCKLDDASTGKTVFTQVSCYDYWQHLDRITINEVFDGVTELSVITTLLHTYAPWIDLSLLPTTSAGQILGQVWRNKTLQWALQKVADIVGYDIWIDPYKKLHFASPTTAQPATFSVSDTPDNISSFPHIVDQFTVDDNAIINRVTFYGGQKPTPDFAQDVSTQANGANKVFILAYYARKSSTGSVTVTVNGASQVLGYVFGTGTKNLLKSQGGTCDVLLDAAAKTLTFDVAPASGASVICTYRYQLPLIIQVAQQDSVSFFGGYYDGTISDETVQDTATAVRRCKVLLLEQAYGLTTIKLRCWRAGLQAGQQLKVVNQLKGINDYYIIQEVSAQPLAYNTIEYTVTLGAWNWNLVDVLQQVTRATATSDTADQETINPTQILVLGGFSVTTTVSISTTTRTGGNYFPGLSPGQTGYAVPALSTV